MPIITTNVDANDTSTPPRLNIPEPLIRRFTFRSADRCPHCHESIAGDEPTHVTFIYDHERTERELGFLRLNRTLAIRRGEPVEDYDY